MTPSTVLGVSSRPDVEDHCLRQGGHGGDGLRIAGPELPNKVTGSRDNVLALRQCAPRVREVGDCGRVSKITNVIDIGCHAGLDI